MSKMADRLENKEFSVLDTQKELFSLLAGKRIFLSGGTGFFGKWLLESFLYVNRTFQLNACLTVLSREPQTILLECPHLKNESALRFLQGDVCSFEFPPDKYDLIIHAATPAGLKFAQEKPDQMHAIIVDGTRRMLDFAKSAEASRFMMTSSGAVYGPQPHDISHVPETYAGTPVTVYGKAKLLAEEMCLEAGDRHGFSVVLPRGFAFVGPYLDLDIHFAIGNFIRDCLEDRPIIIHGDGTPWRSYLYAADLAEWLWTILLRGKHAQAYNVGSEEAVSIRDLAYRVRQCAQTSNPVNIMQNVIPGTNAARYVPSVQRALVELGLKPRYSLDEAILRTWTWHKGIS
jgi:nucleoside-diphosphate-sugar epimerase